MRTVREPDAKVKQELLVGMMMIIECWLVFYAPRLQLRLGGPSDNIGCLSCHTYLMLALASRQ